MPSPDARPHVALLLIRYSAVSLVGFVADLSIIHALMWLKVEPAWARVVSLLCAMQITFLLNAFFVFHNHRSGRLSGQWARYMLSNGFGNFCNYWVFVTMVSTHWRWVSDPNVAVACGSITAWTINFTASRWVVFSRRRPG